MTSAFLLGKLPWIVTLLLVGVTCAFVGHLFDITAAARQRRKDMREWRSERP